jgi:hypothetical protein
MGRWGRLISRSRCIERETLRIMDPNRAPKSRNGRAIWACCLITNLILLSGCVTTFTLPEQAWVRTDGRKIGDDPELLQQGKGDIAICDANLDSGTPTASARGCMAQKGYVLVQKNQAEDVRAAYAAAAKRNTPDR